MNCRTLACSVAHQYFHTSTDGLGASHVSALETHCAGVLCLQALQRRSVAVPAKTDRESDDELRPPSGRRLRRGERSIATLRPVAAHRECNSRQW